MFMKALVTIIALTAAIPVALAMDRSAAALRIANDLGIPHTSDKQTLYGLYPETFPGGYNGVTDLSYYDQSATLENVIVALVRWTGWDTVHYNTKFAEMARPYVSPKGFPYYAPDPTPRSIPYVAAALQNNLLTESDLPKLRSLVTNDDIDRFCQRVKRLSSKSDVLPPLMLDENGMHKINSIAQHPEQFLILPTGFTKYDQIRHLPNRFIDFNASELRIFNAKSDFSSGRQGYFPLGPLETQLGVGLRVNSNSYSHQAESIYGEIENESTTVNAVGLWGAASSLKRNARVWGGFFLARTPTGPKNDAQVIGLEVDTISNALPGISPNRSKVGVQIVGIGSQTLTNALEIIGAGPAKWSNGILFDAGAIAPNGAVIGLSDAGEVTRGIDFSQARFTDSAFLVGLNSRISFRNRSGAASTIYTDSFDNGHFVLRAGPSGLRITNNEDSSNLAVFDTTGNIITPRGNFYQLLADVSGLKKRAADVIPQSTHDKCEKGDLAEDSTHIYVCIEKNHWRRAQLSDW
jgi:hypothetical protein